MRSEVVAVLALGLLLVACDSGGTASPPPASASSSTAASSILPPPSGQLPTGALGLAGDALVAAAHRTAETGTLRVRISAQLTQTGSSRGLTLTGLADSESKSRFSASLAFTVNGKTTSTETVSYDGTTWTRSPGSAWRQVAAPAGTDPRSYVGYLSGISAVVAQGTGEHGGYSVERFSASVSAPTTSAQPAPAPASTGPRSGAMTAFVDRATGRLVGEDITFSDPASSTESTIHIDFYDFGKAIVVSRPEVTTASTSP